MATLLVTLGGFEVVAQNADVIAADTTNMVVDQASDVSSYEPTIWENIMSVISTILGALAVLSIIGHMVYLKYVKYLGINQYDVAYFRNLRVSSSRRASSSAAEDSMVIDYMNRVTDGWKEDVNPDTGEEECYPTKMKQVNISAEMIDKAIELAPTDPGLVDLINEATALINEFERREFTGSKILSWIAIGIGVIPVFFGAWLLLPLMLTSVGIYYSVSKTCILAV